MRKSSNLLLYYITSDENKGQDGSVLLLVLPVSCSWSRSRFCFATRQNIFYDQAIRLQPAEAEFYISWRPGCDGENAVCHLIFQLQTFVVCPIAFYGKEIKMKHKIALSHSHSMSRIFCSLLSDCCYKYLFDPNGWRCESECELNVNFIFKCFMCTYSEPVSRK